MPTKSKSRVSKEKGSKSKKDSQPLITQLKNRTAAQPDEVQEPPAARKSKSRKAKSNAIDNAVWMDAGCNKGIGATAAFTESRKRSLSTSKEETRKKRLKADAGDSIPEMDFNDPLSEDSDLGGFGANEHNHSDDSEELRPQAPPKARTNAVNPPADLDETSSSESEASSGSDAEATNDDESETESQNEEVVKERFALEQAKVVKRASDRTLTQEARSAACTTSSKPPLQRVAASVSSSVKPSTKPNSRLPASFILHIPSDSSTKPSKRNEAHQKEQPMINKNSDPQASEPEVRVWSSAATAVIKSDGKIGILDQPPTLRAVLTRAYKVAIEHCLFNNMYPAYDKPATFMRPLFLKAAAQVGNRKDVSAETKSGAREIFERFQQDPTLARIFARLAMGRYQGFRASSKTVAEDLPLLQFYNLTKLKQYEIERLLNKELENNLFVYGRKRSGEKLKSAPYSHPALQELCRIWGFRIKGAQSIGLMFMRKYSTTLPDDEEHQEPELPIAFVAAAAAALEVALTRLRSGIKSKSGRFDEDTYSPVYQYHVRYLNNIKEKFPVNFHQIMSDLLRYARDAPEEQVLNDDFDFDDRDESDAGMDEEVAEKDSGENQASGIPSIDATGGSTAGEPVSEDVVTAQDTDSV
ncbi:hypothetical protein PM082_003621 [Marasmius tenuissimus]|nr:hypothetical protein PM082_003621 [Marasmius tenuissimus]